LVSKGEVSIDDSRRYIEVDESLRTSRNGVGYSLSSKKRRRIESDGLAVDSDGSSRANLGGNGDVSIVVDVEGVSSRESRNNLNVEGSSRSISASV